MSALSFIYHYYRNSDIGDIYRPCQISVSGLRLVNKESSSKEKDLIRAFSRRSATLLDDGSEIISINIL